MLTRALLGLLLLLLAGGGAFAVFSAPQRLPSDRIAAEASGDAARGEQVFWAGGCASCHAAGDNELALGGGAALPTPVGVFHPPNISPHREDGIGAWTIEDFANALQRGVAPDGSHYYPAFPFGSYAHTDPQEVADLFAFLKTLEPVAGASPPDEIAFPFNVRRGVGLWKRVFLTEGPVIALPAEASVMARRGQALVEGAGHCGECHTPRTLGGLGGLDAARWLAGGPNPEGAGRIPNITPSTSGIGSWSEDDIAYFLESGFTPDFDVVGGSMAEVQAHLARLPPEDLQAIAAYLKAVPAVD